MQVPTKPSSSTPSLNELYFLVMAPPKFGKSTWASQMGDNIFLDVENGLKFLNVRRMPTPTWTDMLDAIGALETAAKRNALECDFIVVDTISRAYVNCFEHACKTGGFSHPADDVGACKHGKGWDRVMMEWIGAIQRLQSLDKGLIFIGHSTTRTIDIIENGLKTQVDKEVLLMPNTGASVISAAVDMTFIGTHRDTKRKVKNRKTGKDTTVTASERVWLTKSESTAEAGERSGSLPAVIPFDAPWLIENYPASAAKA